MSKNVYYLSDGTGITAQTLGQSLLSQFESLNFDYQTVPYIDSPIKAQHIHQLLAEDFEQNSEKPLVFATFADETIRQIIANSPCIFIDFLETFIGPLEEAFQVKSSHTIGRSHSMLDYDHYKTRIDAVNFALTTDDGSGLSHYEQAEVILVGVSRCGKTPTCLYLALQFGVFAANYPMTDEDFQHATLPSVLRQFRHKLFGLTIDLQRLQAIRSERRPNSQYSSLEQCQNELFAIDRCFRQERIEYLNTTNLSIEEISTKIAVQKNLTRRKLK